MAYLGDFALGSTVYAKFTTIDSTGLPITVGGTLAAAAYPNDSTTQITAGITATEDFDAVTGLHHLSIVATSGNGYATATDYTLSVATGTVSSISIVGYVIHSFSIENRGLLRPTVAGRTLDVTAAGEAGIDWANIGSPTTAQNLSATNIDVDQIVASVSGAVGSVTGAVGSVTGLTNATIADAVLDEDMTAHQTLGTLGQAIGDPVADTTTIYQSVVTDAAGTNIAADIIVIESQTDDIGVAGAGLTAINLPDQTMNITGNITGNLSGSVGSVTGAVGSVTGLTAANLDATVSSRATPAQVNAEVVDGLATDTYAEPGQEAPAATNTIAAKLGYLFKAWRNRSTQTSTQYSLYNDDATTLAQKATVSDDATTFDKGEVGTGP